MNEIAIPLPQRACCEHVAAGAKPAGTKIVMTGTASGYEVEVCAECQRGSEYLVLDR